MLLSIRLLHEGTLMPALRRIVSVLDEATPNILALILVLAPLTALTSLMHSQLFGLFDEGFSDPFVSLTRIINMLTAPPPQANTEGKIFDEYPDLAEYRFRVSQLPKLKEYLTSDHCLLAPFNMKFAKINNWPVPGIN